MYRRTTPRPALLVGLLAVAACTDSDPSTSTLTNLTSLAGPSPSGFDDDDDDGGDPGGDPGGGPTAPTESTATDGTQTEPDPTSGPTTASTSGPTSDPSGDPASDPSSDPSGDPASDPDTTAPPDTGDEGCVPCQDLMQTATPDPFHVVLVLDKSGSMTADPGGYWDHDNSVNTAEVTRWQSLHAVISAVAPAYDDTHDFGAVLYPSKSASSDYSQLACPVNGVADVPLGPNQSGAIVAAMPAAGAKVMGGQPMAAAVATAHDALADAAGGGPGAIVLVGDSAANCSEDAVSNDALFETYDENAVDAVAAANADGFPVYVVGIEIANTTSGGLKDGSPDNTNSFSRYNELAVAGGRPKGDPGEKFYNCFDQADLQAAYQTILDDLVDCTITLEQEPVDPGALEVTVGGASAAMVGSCQGQTSGWAWVAPYSEIELCGQTCAAFATAGEAALFADCGC